MSLKRNVIANYLGQGWAALMGIAFVPLYILVLGMEAYGLIGVFAILQAAVALLDLGLTPTLTREMARLRAGAHTPESIRDLLRSLELLYFLLTAGMVLTVWFCAPWMTEEWLRVKGLPPSFVVRSIQIMGFVLATRWLEQVYRGALQGLQDMVWLNGTQAVLATLRWGGAYAVLVLVSPTITAFFAWQGLVSILTVLILVHRTYRLLPGSQRPARFDLSSLSEIRGFAGGMFFGSLLGFLLMQADKIVISKTLPLEQLGYYTLAATGAGGLLQLITPMNTAVFPRLTEHVARSEPKALAGAYIRSCEWMAAAIVAPALVLTFFAEPTLLLWTGDAPLSRSVAPLLSLLALGTLLNGLMNLPYMLQLAHGWISFSVKTNLIAVSVVVPVLLWAVPRYGSIGAASVWVALNVSYILVGAHFMHRKLLPDVKRRWYKVAVVGPLLAGGAMAVLVRATVPTPESRASAGLVVLSAGIAVALAVWSVLPAVRSTVSAVIKGVAKSRQT